MTNPDNTVGTNAGYDGRTTPNAFNDILGAFSRGLISGWACSPKSGMTVQIGGNGTTRDVAIAEDNAGNRLTINNRTATPVKITLAGAPATGNRIDSIVAYIANPPTGTGATSVDFPEAVGIIAVSGTAAGTPSAPDEAAIRSAITADGATGATAYYVVLANITVGQGVTVIGSGVISAGAYAQVSTNIVDPTPADGSITTPKLANSSVTTPKLANGSVTGAKLDADAVGMVYLGKASLSGAAATLTITLGTTYDNYRVIGCGAMATGSNTYIDLQMLDGSTPIKNYHQVQRVENTTWSSEIVQDTTYANNTYSVKASEGFQFEMNVYQSGTNWTRYDCVLGSGGGLAFHTAIANGRNSNATKPTGFKLVTGATFAVGSWIKVWGWNN